jgi:predicted transglutaminase-like cysteine proteinase
MIMLGSTASGGLASGDKQDSTLRNAAEFNETLPPIGFVNFCAANASECDGYGLIETLVPDKIKLSAELWSTLHSVNVAVNSAVTPVSDDQLYGKPEFWTYPTTAGDCEDYLLLKKKLLQDAGLPANSLRITVAFDENGQGHAVLTVVSSEGDYVLDNRRNDIRLWNQTGYVFLKRQSGHNPKHWVALSDRTAKANTAVPPSRP